MVNTPGTHSLLEALAGSAPEDLRVIAQMRGVAVRPEATKGELVQVLAAELGTPASVQTALTSLSVPERLAWNAIVQEMGSVPADRFMSYFGVVPRAARRWDWHERPLPITPPARRTPCEGLWYRGLVFADNQSERALYVPREVLALAGQPLPLPPAELERVAVPPEPGPPCDLLGDILTFLCYIKREQVKLVRGVDLPKRHLLGLNSTLSVSHDWGEARPAEYSAPYLGFVRMLLRHLQLTDEESGYLVPGLRAAGWLAAPRREQMARIWRIYLRQHDMLAERELPFNYDVPIDKMRRGRDAVFTVLRECPVGQWITFSSFVRRLQREHPCMLRSWRFGYSEGYWTLRGDDGESVPVHVSWDRTEGAFARNLIGTSLTWLGLTQVDAGQEAFQLTSLGAFLLGVCSTWEDEPPFRPLILQPNFEVLAPAEANPADVFRLVDIADLVKRDRVSTYAVTVDSVRRGLEAGQTADEMIAFLAKATGRDVPQNVAYTLREWAGRYGEIQMRRAIVLTVARESLLSELRTNSKIRLPIEEELGPQAVALPDDDYKSLVGRLRKAGYSPKVGPGIANGETRAAPTVQISEADLVPLLAAASVVEERGGQRLFPDGLLSRVADCIARANRLEVQSYVRQIQTVLDETLQVRRESREPAARFATALTLRRLEDAIKTQTPVQLEYYAEGSAEMLRETVDPYRLEHRHGRDYLVAFSQDVHQERRFLVDLIRSAEPAGWRFRRSKPDSAQETR